MTKEKSKLSDAVIEMPNNGNCIIDIDKAVVAWNAEKTFIGLINSTQVWQLCEGDYFRITINKDDAIKLINRLELVKVQVKPFNGYSFMTKERAAFYEAQMKVPYLAMEVIEFILNKQVGLNSKELKEYYKGIKSGLKTLHS